MILVMNVQFVLKIWSFLQSLVAVKINFTKNVSTNGIIILILMNAHVAVILTDKNNILSLKNKKSLYK